MKRRCYLALLSASLAGCSELDTTEREPTTATETTPEVVERHPTLSHPNENSVDEADLRSTLAEANCAAIAPSELYCSQPDPPDDAPVVASAASATATLPSTVTVTLENRHDERFVHTAADWNLRKATDDGWRYIGPTFAQAELDTVRPGETHRWELTFEAEPRTVAPDPEPRTVAGLGPGVYAVTNEGDFVADGEPAEIVEPVTVSAVFGLGGEYPTVRPPEAVRTDEGYRIDLRRDDAEQQGTETTVERTGSADAELAFEQMTQKAALRAAVPYLLDDDSLDRVTVVTSESVVDAPSYLETVAGSTSVSLFGEAFEVS